MTRHALLRAVALAAACSACGAGERERPDVLLVVVDTLRADRVGVLGCERETTPALDALAAQGVVFERAHAHSGWTLPSMTSLFTGLLPHEHGVGRDDVDRTLFHGLDGGARTLAERFAASGYATAAFVNNTFLAPEFGLDRGFGTYDYRGATRQSIRSAEETVDAALAWLEGREEPWFLLVHVMEPHLAYDPPAEDRGRFTPAGEPPVEVPFASEATLEDWELGRVVPSAEELAYVEGLYEEEVRAVDRALGRLFEGLGERRERTLAFVTSDHGEEFFERGAFEHGHALWGVLTRVPLLVVGPGVEPGRVGRPTAHRALAAALAALAGGDAAPLHAWLGGAAGAEDGPEEVLVGEDCLYGPPRASLTADGYRLHYDLAAGTADVWRLDEDGLEVELVTGLEGAERRDELVERLRALRGDLEPRSAGEGTRIEDLETFDELRALGYLDRD